VNVCISLVVLTSSHVRKIEVMSFDQP